MPELLVGLLYLTRQQQVLYHFMVVVNDGYQLLLKVVRTFQSMIGGHSLDEA
jgi:hypothetical protein